MTDGRHAWEATADALALLTTIVLFALAAVFAFTAVSVAWGGV